MKLIGNLKKKVENAKTKEEAQDTIKKAGMLLDDDELEQVSGGGTVRTPNVGDRDINYYTGEDFYTGGETYRGSQTTMPLTQGYTPIETEG